MKLSSYTVLAAGLLAGAATLSAQTPTPRNPFGTGELPEFLKPYDLNNDGVLSVEERQAFEKALHEAHADHPGAPNPWDTDGDGVLSEAEKEAARAAIAARIEDQRTKRFNELDVDDDGLLTAAELAAIPHITPTQVAAMIAHLDKDGDGKISLAEFTAPLAPMPPPFPPLPDLPHPPPCPVPPILKSFDTDNNGILSPAEFAAFVAALDTNGDHRVSGDEWRAYLLAHPELLPPPPPPPTSPTPPPPSR